MTSFKSFEKFRNSSSEASALYPLPFAELPASALCDPTLYCSYAFWCMNKTPPYAYNTLVLYTRTLINQAARLDSCKTFEGFARFFACLEPNSTSWLSQMLSNVRRDSVARAVKLGEAVQTKVVPIYLSEMREICRSCARVGTKDAAYRKLVLRQLFSAGGRAGEVASLSWDMLIFTQSWRLKPSYRPSGRRT